ncbi:hypothetical protein P9112_002294 [Eukaryota sp. TZLM1-RC]
MVLRDFSSQIKAVADARFKNDEEKVMQSEVLALKKVMTSSDMNLKKTSEMVLRVIYAEMLGYDASFGYIHAVNLTQAEQLIPKRIGYLACSLCLHPDHDLLVLLVNSLQRDLRSKNPLIISIALSAACRLLSAEMIPAVVDQVFDLVTHKQPLVRKKSLSCLHSFFERSPSSIQSHLKLFPQALIDKSPSVIGVAVLALCTLSKNAPDVYRYTVPSLISLLRQVGDNLFPVGYSYRKFPHPWLQTHLLRCLAYLCEEDVDTADSVSVVITEILLKRDTNSNIGAAITFESIRTASAVLSCYDDDDYSSNVSSLYDVVSQTVSQFISSEQPNYKYMGLQMLTHLVCHTPSVALVHQVAVLHCLEDSDDTIRKCTLELLYRMASSDNLEVIVDRLLEYLREYGAVDSRLTSTLVSRVVSLAERFSSSLSWFVSIVCQLYEAANGVVDDSVTLNLINVSSFGEVGDLEAKKIVDCFINLSGKTPFSLIGLGCHFIGNFTRIDHYRDSLRVLKGYLTNVLLYGTESITASSINVVSIISAALNLISKYGTSEIDQELSDLIADVATGVYSSVVNISARHSAVEFTRLCHSLSELLVDFQRPLDCDDFDDFELAVSDIASNALDNGALSYEPQSQRVDYTRKLESTDEPQDPSSSLRFDAYEEPVDQTPVEQSEQEQLPVVEENLKLKESGVAKKWGKGGLIKSSATSQQSHVSRSESPSLDAGLGVVSRSSEPLPSQKLDIGQRRAVEKVVEDQHLDEDKQQLANALFGGVKKRKAVREKKTTVDTSHAQKVDEFDLLGDLSVAPSTDSPFCSPRKQDEDLLSAFMVSGDSDNLDLNTVPNLAFLKEHSIISDCSSLTREVIAQDDVIHLSEAVINSSKRGKLLLIANKSKQSVSVLSLTGLSRFSLYHDSSVSVGGNKLVLPALDSGRTIGVFISPKNIASLSSDVFELSITWKFSSDSPEKIINCNVAFDLGLFITKWALKTPQFGKLWSTLHNSQKCNLKFSNPNPRNWINYLESRTGITAVDVSGSEGISALQLAIGEGVKVLVHARLGNGSVLITIKSSEASILAHVAKYIVARCK